MKLCDLFEQNTLPIDLQDSLPPTFVIPELKSSDAYMQYRHSVAMAAANATHPTKPEKESVWGENQTVICYTPQEKEILDKANHTMGVQAIAIAPSPSHESSYINKKSPVRPFKDFLK